MPKIIKQMPKNSSSERPIVTNAECLSYIVIILKTSGQAPDNYSGSISVLKFGFRERLTQSYTVLFSTTGPLHAASSIDQDKNKIIMTTGSL